MILKEINFPNIYLSFWGILSSDRKLGETAKLFKVDYPERKDL